MEELTNATVYEKLKTLRRARGLSVQKLAEKMGEHHQKVGRVERGQTNLTIDYLLKLSKALETSIDTIVNEVPPQKGEKPQDNPNLLSEIVLWVEKHEALLSLQNNPEKKAKTVSLLYTQGQKVPQAQQPLFLETLLATLELIF